MFKPCSKQKYIMIVFFLNILLLIIFIVGCKSEPKYFSTSFPVKEIDLDEKSVYDDKFIRIEPIKVNTEGNEIKVSLRVKPSEKLLSMGFNELRLPHFRLEVSNDGKQFEELYTPNIRHEAGRDKKGDYHTIIYGVKDYKYDKNSKFRMYITSARAFKREDKYFSYDKDKSMVLNKYDDLGLFKIRSIEEVDRKNENILVKFEFITQQRHPITPYFSLIKENGEELKIENYSSYSTYEHGLVEGGTYHFESESGLKGESEVTLRIYKLKMNFLYSKNRCLEFEI